MFNVIGYEQAAACVNCEKDGECVVIKTEAYSGPHCGKCVMKEAKKRSRNGKPEPMPKGDRFNPDAAEE